MTKTDKPPHRKTVFCERKKAKTNIPPAKALEIAIIIIELIYFFRNCGSISLS